MPQVQQVQLVFKEPVVQPALQVLPVSPDQRVQQVQLVFKEPVDQQAQQE